MKKLALINTYCNNWERLNILHNNIIKLKELNIDSLVYSPLPLPKEITELADYTFITKENPVLFMPERGMNQWRILHNSKFQQTVITPDYGWASIYQYQKLIEIASFLDYDHYFPFIYDLKFDDIVLSTFNTSPSNLFFPSPKAGASKVGNNFMSLSKENAIKMLPLFNKEKYKEVCTKNIAEKFMEYLCNEIQGTISDHLTNDDIHETHNIFNFLPHNIGIGLYIHNVDTFKFHIYGVTELNQPIQFLVNGQNFEYIIQNHEEYFDLGINIGSTNQVIINYNNQSYDISKYYQFDYKSQHYIDLL